MLSFQAQIAIIILKKVIGNTPDYQLNEARPMSTVSNKKGRKRCTAKKRLFALEQETSLRTSGNL